MVRVSADAELLVAARAEAGVRGVGVDAESCLSLLPLLEDEPAGVADDRLERVCLAGVEGAGSLAALERETTEARVERLDGSAPVPRRPERLVAPLLDL